MSEPAQGKDMSYMLAQWAGAGERKDDSRTVGSSAGLRSKSEWRKSAAGLARPRATVARLGGEPAVILLDLEFVLRQELLGVGLQ